MKALVIFAAILLVSCAQSETDNQATPEPSAPSPAPTSADPTPDQATAENPAPAPGPPPPPSRPPGAEPQPGDLPPCPGINPDIRRPAGSNCLGITPDQCGAGEAQKYVGKQGTASTRDALSKMAKGRFRWIEHMQAVTDDLDPSRMNVSLDQNGRIEKIDCF